MIKSKEEIEQLAETKMLEFKKAMSKIGFGTYQEPFLKVIKEWYMDGYTQCQEDMADKKYTEEDLRQAIERTYRYVDNDGWSLDYIKEDIINSLNKQDNEK